jgi:hypothetical protein
VRGACACRRALAEIGRLAQEIVPVLDKARAMLRGLEGKPGAPKASLDDVRTQLEHLAPADLFLVSASGLSGFDESRSGAFVL